MIHVKRPVPDPADVLNALAKPFPKHEAKSELELAREYYSSVPPPEKAYEFSRYKEFEVCKALDDLFHEKCAYCESSYRAVDALDVEHYRPKGGVTEAKEHRGYWWLAAVWSNLLPSCPPCNQRRRHLAFDPGMTLDEFEIAQLKQAQTMSGKANSFPVRGNNWIADEHGDVAAEDPLLINPTERRPEDHIEWVFDWDRSTYLWEAKKPIPFVRPRMVNGEDDPYGKASIAVYGLNRAGLVRERMARVHDLQLFWQPAIDTILKSQNVQNEEKLRSLLQPFRNVAMGYARPEKPYSGMVGAFLAEFDRELTRLAASAV